MKIIVLSHSDYKEKDAIYDAISETESLSFKLNHVKSGSSPYLWMNNPMTIAEIEFGDRRYKYPPVKDAKLLFSPLNDNSDFNYLKAIGMMNETTLSIVDKSERYLLFKDIEEAIDSLSKTKKYHLIAAIFLARAMKIAGVDLQVDRCVFCGKTKDIVAFSFDDGGFVCKECADKTVERTLSSTQMRLIRYLFRTPNYSCQKSEDYSINDIIIIMRHLKQYVEDCLGVTLKSIDAFIK